MVELATTVKDEKCAQPLDASATITLNIGLKKDPNEKVVVFADTGVVADNLPVALFKGNFDLRTLTVCLYHYDPLHPENDLYDGLMAGSSFMLGHPNHQVGEMNKWERTTPHDWIDGWYVVVTQQAVVDGKVKNPPFLVAGPTAARSSLLEATAKIKLNFGLKERQGRVVVWGKLDIDQDNLHWAVVEDEDQRVDGKGLMVSLYDCKTLQRDPSSERGWFRFGEQISESDVVVTEARYELETEEDWGTDWYVVVTRQGSPEIEKRKPFIVAGPTV